MSTKTHYTVYFVNDKNLKQIFYSNKVQISSVFKTASGKQINVSLLISTNVNLRSNYTQLTKQTMSFFLISGFSSLVSLNVTSSPFDKVASAILINCWLLQRNSDSELVVQCRYENWSITGVIVGGKKGNRTEPNRTNGLYRTKPTEISDYCGTGFYLRH